MLPGVHFKFLLLRAQQKLYTQSVEIENLEDGVYIIIAPSTNHFLRNEKRQCVYFLRHQSFRRNVSWVEFIGEVDKAFDRND